MIYEQPTQQGWICPRCGKVLAPWMSQCDCATPTVSSSTIQITNTGTDPAYHGSLITHAECL